MGDHKCRYGRSARKRSKDLVDHEGWPEETLEDREHVFPEGVCLLPEVHEGSEDPQAVDRPSTGGTSVIGTYRHPPHVDGASLLAPYAPIWVGDVPFGASDTQRLCCERAVGLMLVFDRVAASR